MVQKHGWWWTFVGQYYQENSWNYQTCLIWVAILFTLIGVLVFFPLMASSFSDYGSLVWSSVKAFVSKKKKKKRGTFLHKIGFVKFKNK